MDTTPTSIALVLEILGRKGTRRRPRPKDVETIRHFFRHEKAHGLYDPGSISDLGTIAVGADDAGFVIPDDIPDEILDDVYRVAAVLEGLELRDIGPLSQAAVVWPGCGQQPLIVTRTTKL